MKHGKVAPRLGTFALLILSLQLFEGDTGLGRCPSRPSPDLAHRRALPGAPRHECLDEMHRLLSPHGRIADLEIYLSLRAAAVSFVRVQDAKKVRGQSSWQLCPLHLIARPLKVLHDAGFRHNANRMQQQRTLMPISLPTMLRYGALVIICKSGISYAGAVCDSGAPAGAHEAAQLLPVSLPRGPGGPAVHAAGAA